MGWIYGCLPRTWKTGMLWSPNRRAQLSTSTCPAAAKLLCMLLVRDGTSRGGGPNLAQQNMGGPLLRA